MRNINAFIFLLVILTAGCKEKKQEVDASEVKNETNSTKSETPGNYVSEKWQFEARFPEGYRAGKFELPAETPVVNIYDTSNVKPPPYAIHEDASLSYVAILPQGFGVDAPAGKQVSYKEWENEVPADFGINEESSIVYLLENGDPWAYSFRLQNPPEGWNRYGSIFLHIKVRDFEAKCFETSDGKEKIMANCDPLGGDDEIRYFGKVDPESEEDLMEILGNIRFHRNPN